MTINTIWCKKGGGQIIYKYDYLPINLKPFYRKIPISELHPIDKLIHTSIW